MARLANPVPRRRRQRPLRRPGGAAPAPVAPRTFSPFILEPGGFHPEDEPARLPPGHTVVTPSGNPAVVHTTTPTPPPPGTTAPTPQVGTVAPTSSTRTAAQIHHEERVRAQRRLEKQLGTLAPLPAPIAPLPFVPIGGNGGPGTNTIPTQIALNQIAYGERVDPQEKLVREGESLLSKIPDASSLPQHQISIAAHPTAQLASERTNPGNLYAANLPVVGADGKRYTYGIGKKEVRANPADPLGNRSLGDVTLPQLRQAAQEGTLRLSKKGVLITPENRQILQQLFDAKRQVDQSGPSLQQLHQAYPELSMEVLKSYRDAARRTGVPPQLLAGIEYQESTYGQSELPGVHSGSNFAGAAGPFQIGNGTGAAGNAWEGIAKELWGDQADQHSIYNQHDAALAAGQYLAHTYGHATSDPSTWYDAALSYNHADWYAQKAVEVAKEHSDLAKLGLPPNPTAVEALQVAKQQARAHGINPTPWNGDVEGGDKEYVYVRADAKGAVNWARSALGTKEGSPKQLHWAELEALGPSEPWCADFVAVNLARRGVPLPEGPNGSWNYEDPAWKGGTQLGTDISKAKPGDLIVYGEGAHIAMYVGDGKVIAGNWGDEVAEYGATEDPRGISAIVRPHYKGGRVKVKAGSLPGSSTESTFGGSVGGAPGSEGAPGAPGETTLAADGGRTPQQAAEAEAALANFTVAPAPGFAASVREPEFGQPSEPAPMSAEQLLQLLGLAAVSRA